MEMGKGVILAHCYSHPSVLCGLVFLSGTLLINSFNFFFSIEKSFFSPCQGACGTFPPPGIEPRPPALEAQS